MAWYLIKHREKFTLTCPSQVTRLGGTTNPQTTSQWTNQSNTGKPLGFKTTENSTKQRFDPRCLELALHRHWRAVKMASTLEQSVTKTFMLDRSTKYSINCSHSFWILNDYLSLGHWSVNDTPCCYLRHVYRALQHPHVRGWYSKTREWTPCKNGICVCTKNWVTGIFQSV
jgi:hypothetical protein